MALVIKEKKKKKQEVKDK